MVPLDAMPGLGRYLPNTRNTRIPIVSGPDHPRLYGPKRVPPNGQIALPKDLLDQSGIAPGGRVYLVAWRGRVQILTEDDLGERLKDLFGPDGSPDRT
jgi:hypothetical protein